MEKMSNVCMVITSMGSIAAGSGFLIALRLLLALEGDATAKLVFAIVLTFLASSFILSGLLTAFRVAKSYLQECNLASRIPEPVVIQPWQWTEK